jgi:hypothetical protein
VSVFDFRLRSFFQKSVDSRFLLLISGTKALILEEIRSSEVVNAVQCVSEFISRMRGITDETRDMLRNGIGRLKRESISEAGKRMVEASLSGRTYQERCPGDFFRKCYGIRSRLVHGIPPSPSREEVSSAAAQLEVMLSDLLSLDLLDVGPRSQPGVAGTKK